MAGLRPRGSAPDALRRRERGQLLLVGAFGLAVLLLVLAGVLNTVAFTESLATRSGDLDSGRDVTAHQADARDAVAGITARINRGAGTYSVKATDVEQSVANWSRATERHHALDVVSTRVNVTGTTNGARIEQTTSREFTNATNRSDWTLANDVSNTRAFTMNVSRGSLVSGSCANQSCHQVVVDDGSATWRVSMNQSAVVVDGPGTSDGSCTLSSDPVLVDVTGGTVNGSECEPLSFADGLSGPYSIRYRNGANASGRYRLTVDDSAATGNFATNGSPSVSQAVYAVSVRVTYRSPRVVYETTIRVARGEPDD